MPLGIRIPSRWHQSGRQCRGLPQLLATRNFFDQHFQVLGTGYWPERLVTSLWNLPLAGSKFTLWEGGIRVPFILSRPGDPRAGETWDQPISTLDVLPTCLEAAGIEIPDGFDGRPIEQSKEARDLFWRYGGDSYAVRSGEWKLIHNGGRSSRKPTSGVVNRSEYLKGTRLFNLREDPAESRDLAAEYPEVVERIRKLYTSWSEKIAGSHGAEG